jgi:hypothetical protein
MFSQERRRFGVEGFVELECFFYAEVHLGFVCPIGLYMGCMGSRVFWNVSIPQNSAWFWRKLLKLRTLARSFLRFDVGTGSPIHLWLDNWHPLGILSD